MTSGGPEVPRCNGTQHAGWQSTYIIVGAHDDDLVGDLGLGGELGLRQGRHVDDRSTPRAVHVGFSPCTELWSFYNSIMIVSKG